MTATAPRDIVVRALDFVGDAFLVIEVEGAGDAPRLTLRHANEAGRRFAGLDRPAGAALPARSEHPVLGALLTFVVAAAATGRDRTHRLTVPSGPRRGVHDVTVTPAGPAESGTGTLVVVASHDVTAFARDVTTLEELFRETASTRSLLQTALDTTSDAFAVYRVHRDATGAVVRTELRVINVAGAEPLGSRGEDLVGQDLREFFPPAVELGLWDALVEAVETATIRRHRVDVYDEAGDWVAAYDNTLAPSVDDMVVVTWRDVTDTVRRSRELAAQAARVTREAMHDALTGLPNRALLLQRMEEALAGRRPGTRIGLVFVDVDHFKGINDRFGHMAGDRVLQAMARTLQSLARATDCVARIGGDEFVVLLSDLPADWSPDAFLTRVIERLAGPVLLDDGIVRPSASLGLVLCPPAEPDIASLLHRADAAMYESKRAGRGRATVG